MTIRTFDTHETVPEEVALDVRAVTASGELRTSTRNSVELGGIAGEVVAIEVEATWDEEEVRLLFPEDERESPPVRSYLVMKSGARGTFRRKALRLQNGTSDRIEFSRRDWRGRVDVQAILVRTTDRPAGGFYAHHAGARLSWSKEWTIWIDERPEFAGDSLPIRWASFEESPGPWGRFSDAFFFVDYDSGPIPELVLNSDIDELVRAIQSNATHGREARSRDAVATLIAHQVWTSLILESAARIRMLIGITPEARDDLEFLWAELPIWVVRIASDWAQSLTGIRARDEALWELVRWSVDATAELALRVPLAIQQRFRTRRGFEGVLKEV